MLDSIPDYYQVLNLPVFASWDEIKKSYKKMTFQFHPDKNPNNPPDAEKFKALSEAYRILKDDELRSEYDKSIFDLALISRDVYTIELFFSKQENDNKLYQDRTAPFLKYDYLYRAIINIKDHSGNTALHYASSFNHLQVVTKLIKYRAKINIKDNYGITALHYACAFNHLQVVAKLIKYRAHINIKDNNGNTPCHYAVMIESIKLLKLLINNGAGIRTKNDAGISVISEAQKSHNKNILLLLLKGLQGQKFKKISVQNNFLRDNDEEIADLIKQLGNLEQKKKNPLVNAIINFFALGCIKIKGVADVDQEILIKNPELDNNLLEPDKLTSEIKQLSNNQSVFNARNVNLMAEQNNFPTSSQQAKSINM